MAKPASPAQRKRRILRDAMALLALLVLLVLALDFPMLSARRALDATQRRHFFSHAQVLAQYDRPNDINTRVEWWGWSDRYYILRRGNWYAWCDLNQQGPFWRSGSLRSVECPPGTPLAALNVTEHRDTSAILVVPGDPAITAVELVAQINGETRTLRHSLPDPKQSWFLFLYDDHAFPSSALTDLRGYDADGKLLATCEILPAY